MTAEFIVQLCSCVRILCDVMTESDRIVQDSVVSLTAALKRLFFNDCKCWFCTDI